MSFTTDSGQELAPGALARTNPTQLYLIRHGEPEACYLNCYYGQDDVPLSGRGRDQSRRLAERLAAVPFDAVYSSDLRRAGYLAELIAEGRGLPVRRLAVFRERHMGILQGLDVKLLETAHEHTEIYRQWRLDRVNFRVPEAENFVDLRDRVLPAIEELTQSFKGMRIALVCHAGPIRVALADALGMPLDNCFRFSLNHCSVSVIEYPHEGTPRVTLING